MSGFEGFPRGALGFFRALTVHQSRDWFLANKVVFETTLRRPMGELVDAVSAELARRRVPLRGEGTGAIFRQHRDVRFSKDKAPYKTNLGAVLSRDGSKRSLGVLYLHLAPGGCFVAAGVHAPEPDALKAIRTRIVAEPRAFRAALARLAKAELELDGEAAMKRLPRGFEGVAPADLQAAVKQRHLIVLRPFPESALGKPAVLVKTAADVAEAALPLLRFCWAATGSGEGS
jgi:uncharacterized protein (TIGR02453 family)